MATRFHKVPGTVEWVKYRADQMDSLYKQYSFDFTPDSWEDFWATGIEVEKIKIKDKETGEVIGEKDAVRLRRPDTKLIGDKAVKFGPIPVFLNEADAKADKNRYDGNVGNGSKATVNVAIFDTQKGKGHRVEGMVVTDLVVFVPENREDVGFKPW